MTRPLTAKRLKRAERKLDRLKRRGDVDGLVDAFAAGDVTADKVLRELSLEARLGVGGPWSAVVPALAAVAEDRARPVGTRSRATYLLADTGDERALKPLVRLLDDESTSIQRTAIDALGRLGDRRAVEPLVSRLESDGAAEDPSGRARLGEILLSLVTVTGGGVRPVEELVKHRSLTGLTAVLRATGVTEAQQATIKGLQVNAIGALAWQFGDPASLEALRELQCSELEGAWWRGLIREALVTIGDPESVEAAGEALSHWLGGNRPNEAGISLARLVAEQGDDRGRRALVLRLVKRLEHAADYRDRRAAVVELRDLTGVEALISVEGREIIAGASRDPLFFSSGRVFEDDVLYALDTDEEARARDAVCELSQRLQATERRMDPDLC